MNSIFRRIYPIQVFYLISEYFVSALLMLWLYKQGVSYSNMILYFMLTFASGIMLILLSRKIKPRMFFALGLGLKSIPLIFYMWLFNKQFFPLMGLFVGGVFLLFWINYNILYFKQIDGEKKAFSSAIYTFTFSFFSTLIPIIAGIVAKNFGMKPVFAISLLFLLLTIIFSQRIENNIIRYDAIRALRCFKGVKTLVLIEGFFDHISFVAIPIISLFFIKSEFGMGAFVSYLGLVGALSALFMAKISDRLKKRKRFVMPISILLGTASFGLFFGNNLYAWIFFSGLASMLLPMIKPFQVAIALDHLYCSTEEIMIARELLLNIGRLVGTTAFFILLSLGHTKACFIIAGIAMLLYPFILNLKGLYKNEK